MTLVRGESIAMGMAVEATRGTFLAATDYLRTREPITPQTVLDKVDIKETKITGFNSQGQVITRSRVEAKAAFNLRFRTIGYLLKSLLGNPSTATEAGETVVYRHTFTLNPTVLQPSLALSLARGAFNHRQVIGAICSRIGIKMPNDDVVNCDAELMGRSESNTSNFTPAFAANDYLAPHHMVTVKPAANTAGLSGATALVLTDSSIDLDRGSRGKRSISSVPDVDFISKLLTVTGELNFEKEDDTYRDLAVANTTRALQFSIINTDQLIGVAARPSLIITLPNVTLIAEESAPLDDVATEKISFVANYDDTAASGLTIALVNEKANYN